ncbi:MAG: glycosyltransferase family 1 protein [Nitrospinae bacterium]|nr:glycosyltransferase family 1 protein [Nitrospinota bacterium]
MKFLIINTDYPEFLNWFYNKHHGLEGQSYEEQMRRRNESLFGVADFYSSNLRKLGHDAWDVHANNEFIQKAWARQHGKKIKESSPLIQRWQNTLQQLYGMTDYAPLSYFNSSFRPILRLVGSWFYDILEAQIKYYKPDVLINQAMSEISSHFMRNMKPLVRLLVGQVASPLPEGVDYSYYDLVISSLPNFVKYFRQKGIRAELHRLAFEPQILSALENNRREIPVSFVGSLSKNHKNRVSLLEYLCGHLDVEVWGQGVDSLPANSIIRQHYKGKVWGIEMYKILNNSKIALNYHIDVAESYANNIRLFEATGTGTLLITDWKMNLHEMFEPSREVVAYHNLEECAELIQYYLKNNNEREAIARAGQGRTLKEHTYYRRVGELVDIIQKCL